LPKRIHEVLESSVIYLLGLAMDFVSNSVLEENNKL